MKKNTCFLITCLAICLLSSAFAAPLSIQLTLTDGDNPFSYESPIELKNGQKLDIEEIKLYVSNVALVKNDGTEVPIQGLNLAVLNKNTEHTDIFKGDAPIGNYRGLRFDIGVPRELNHKDATRAKSPLSIEDGMFWAWNSGYIFLSLKGKTAVVDNTSKDVALHVGGDNHRITVNLADLQKPKSLKVTDKGAKVPVVFNLAALLSMGVNGESWDLSKAKYRQVHMGIVANQLAKNANSAFSKQMMHKTK